MIDNKITIKDDEKVNIQRGAIGHRSTWSRPYLQIRSRSRQGGKKLKKLSVRPSAKPDVSRAML